jgi:predicted RNase H-like HicB family nuclease
MAEMRGQWGSESAKERIMIQQTLTAVIHREDNLYVAQCPEVGTASQGTSVEDAVANLKEATELYLEEFPVPATDRPFMTTFEAVHG